MYTESRWENLFEKHPLTRPRRWGYNVKIDVMESGWNWVWY
jgi:hypothetical protein